MRILHVTPGISVAQGGLQSALLGICRAQASADITPVIASLHETAAPDAAFDAFETHLFPCDFRPTGASPELKRWLATNMAAFDAVVAHSIWRDPLFYAAHAQRLFIVAHGMLDPEALAFRAWRKLWRRRFKLPQILRRATLVYTCQAEQQRAQAGPAAEAQASAVIPLAVELPPVPPAAPDGPIVALGRLHPRKGWLEWVEALKLLADRGVQFHAVQAGPVEDARYAGQVYASAAELGEKLSFIGVLNHAQSQALLAAASVVAAPCAVAENFGMVIAEGMALGKPVVAGRKGLIVEELAQAGAAVAAANVAEFADALQSLLTNQAKAAQIGTRGRQWAEERYAPEVVGKQWKQLLESST